MRGGVNAENYIHRPFRGQIKKSSSNVLRVDDINGMAPLCLVIRRCQSGQQRQEP
jgi:hypothetical protein